MTISQAPMAYQATVGIVVAFLLYLILFLTGYIQFDVSSLLTFYAFSVYTVSLAAVLGGVLLGMFIATRTLSTQGFTPFEVSMLRLRDEVISLQKEVRIITKHLEKEKEEDSE
tara:strand:+ start:1854 stop:2192 length:339 start_codon:yes stop_codon:yes gene_type:complete